MQINIYTGRFRMHFGKHFMSPSPNPKCMRILRVKAIEEFIWGAGEGGGEGGREKKKSHHILWKKFV